MIKTLKRLIVNQGDVHELQEKVAVIEARLDVLLMLVNMLTKREGFAVKLPGEDDD